MLGPTDHLSTNIDPRLTPGFALRAALSPNEAVTGAWLFVNVGVSGELDAQTDDG